MSEQEDFDALSRRLSRTHFSADSRVQESLRARLLSGRRAASPARVATLALTFAAAALLLLFSLRTKLHPAEESRIATEVRLPAVAPLPRAARKAAYPRGEQGLPVLPGFLAAAPASGEASPLSSRAVDHLIEIHRGRTVRGKDRSAVVWRIDGTAYGLETRRVSLADIFDTRRSL